MSKYLMLIPLGAFLALGLTIMNINQEFYERHNPADTPFEQQLLDDIYRNGWVLTGCFFAIGIIIFTVGLRLYPILNPEEEEKYE